MSLDIAEVQTHLRLHFKQWVLCIVHGTHKYGIWQNNFKTGSHGTIHTFKNYFVIVFSIFSSQQLRYPVRLHFISIGPWALFIGPATWEKC